MKEIYSDKIERKKMKKWSLSPDDGHADVPYIILGTSLCLKCSVVPENFVNQSFCLAFNCVN